MNSTPEPPPAKAVSPNPDAGNAPRHPLVLWYGKPAEAWVEALPIGNGRLGAMIFGRTERERVQMNEDTFWSGRPYDQGNPEALAAFPEVRRLVFEGRYKEAEDLYEAKMMGRPLMQCSFQPIGDLYLEFEGTKVDAEGYRRELDLDTATASVTWLEKGVRLTREIFSSAVSGVMVMRIRGEKPGAVTFRGNLSSAQECEIQCEDGDTLVLRGDGGGSGRNGIPGELGFEIRVKAIAEGGTVHSASGGLTVFGADSVVLLIAAETAFKKYDDISGDPEARTRKRIGEAVAKSFAGLRKEHLRAHREIFRRVELDLGGGDKRGELPTDERLKRFAGGEDDPALAALYYQYGRYLLMSSSRPGSQPSTLQGLWNDMPQPPWDSKYTININTEMNYWPADMANMAETFEPVVRMLEDLSETGAKLAKLHYGAGGWVVHHNTDLWRQAAPVDGAYWGAWPMGGAWLCTHLWEHYQFGGDVEFLRRVYPVLRGACEFYLDFLVEEPGSRWLVTCPSISPENPHPFGSTLCAGPAMDGAILRDFFEQTAAAAEVLGVDGDFRGRLAASRPRLAPLRVGKAGQLQEWMEDWDVDAPEQWHRHTSHLYALHPSAQITLEGTPELAHAAAKTLEVRGDFSTGWAIAWRLNLRARLKEGDRCHAILKALMGPERTYPNMFDAHPPFQIDGNFGAVSGMTEMLLQSHRRMKGVGSAELGFVLDLLPALPGAWPEGEVKGLRARGGFEVDVAWKGGKLKELRVRSRLGKKCEVQYGEMVRKLETVAGGEYGLDGKLAVRTSQDSGFPG